MLFDSRTLGLLGVLAAPAAAQPTSSDLLTDIPVTGTLDGGGTFEGLLTITELAIVDGVLTASGTLVGTATQGTTASAQQQVTEQIAGAWHGVHIERDL